MPTHHPLRGALIGVFAFLLAATSGAQEIAVAVEKAAQFLLAKQRADGAWSSEVYGTLRDPLELTPHVASTMYFLGLRDAASAAGFQRAAEFLATAPMVEERLSIYTATGASWVMMLAGRGELQKVWVERVRARQFNTANGWNASDTEFGGWSYSTRPPAKPPPGMPRNDGPNLSATVFAIGAMRAASVPPEDPVYAEALRFTKRCQNFPGDGGFFFSATEPFRNKAGGEDGQFASYGSATCDGVRLLIRCGLGTDHPRVVAARQWLERNFSASSNPGVFAADREELRNAYYYYYAWSFAHAMQALGIRELETPRGRLLWTREFARELISRQNEDGSWTNRFTDGKEDDPLVATPLAVAALLLGGG